MTQGKSTTSKAQQRASQSPHRVGGQGASKLRPLRALHNIGTVFNGAPLSGIPSESFDRLRAADTSGLPEASFFRARDGFTLAYRHYPAATEWITVVLHGAAGHSGHMHALASRIADSGASQVCCIDLRGHGFSGEKRGFEVRYFDQMAHDVEDFIASLRSTAPPARIMLAGFSAGGGLAIRVARRLPPGDIAAFVLLAPFISLDSPTTRPGLGGWARPNIFKIRLLAMLSHMGIRRFNNAEVVEFSLPRSARDGYETPTWSLNTLMAFATEDWRAELSAIQESQPTLLIAADADECLIGEEYSALVQSRVPHAQVKMIEACGHWDLLVAPQTAEETISWLSAVVRDRPEAGPEAGNANSP